MSLDQYHKLIGQQVKPRGKGSKPAKESKYKNRKVIIDGHAFDSKKEGKRYIDLKLLQRAGQIKDLRMQVSFELMAGVKFENEKRKKPAMRYVADFVYTDVKTGLQVVEDVKSAMTRKLPAYRQKKHLMMSVHGIEIREI